jgi:hypothetical protein
VRLWSCGNTVPAPKQATAPATIKTDFRGERWWLSLARSTGALTVVRANPFCEFFVLLWPSQRIHKMELLLREIERLQQVRRLEELRELTCRSHLRLLFRRLGWQVDVLDLGDGFPFPSVAQRATSLEILSAVPGGCPVVPRWACVRAGALRFRRRRGHEWPTGIVTELGARL